MVVLFYGPLKLSNYYNLITATREESRCVPGAFCGNSGARQVSFVISYGLVTVLISGQPFQSDLVDYCDWKQIHTSTCGGVQQKDSL